MICSPEIIVRLTFTKSLDDDETAIPMVMVLANAAGFRWLAEHFAGLARNAERLVDQSAEQLQGPDPDDHSHLCTVEPPFNGNLSDAFELRFGSLTLKNRDIVIAKYGIAP